jgi:hypothetical protein
MRGQPDAGDDGPDVETEDQDEADAAPARRAPALSSAAMPGNESAPAAAIRADARKLDVAKLQAALQDLIACRQLLDGVMKDG